MTFRIHKIDVTPEAPGSWILINPDGTIASYHLTRDEARKAAGLKPARKPLAGKVVDALLKQARTGAVTVIKVPGGTIEIG